MASFFPPIGTWYKDQNNGQCFEVVAIDDKQNTVEVQFYDGDIGEFEIESWGSLNIHETEAPEQAYSSLSGASYYSEDMGIDGSFALGNPLEFIEPDTFSGFDDLF